MSKIDSIQFEIERLCRKYPEVKKREELESRVQLLKDELMELVVKERKEHERGSLYREHLLVPSLFNSGCVIGKRGMTALEIDNGEIRLVHWFDEDREQKHPYSFEAEARDQELTVLPGTSYRRQVVKSEALDYVFSRIRLLA